jgi:hypothetical protein
MPNTHLPWVLLQNASLPDAVLEELTAQFAPGLPILVPRPHRRAEDDASTVLSNPVVKLVVLIPYEFLVEHADAVEYRAWPHPEIDRIGLHLLAGELELRANPETRTHGNRDRVPDWPSSDLHHWAAHVVSTRASQSIDTGRDVIWSYERVAIDARNDLASSCVDREV